MSTSSKLRFALKLYSHKTLGKQQSILFCKNPSYNNFLIFTNVNNIFDNPKYNFSTSQFKYQSSSTQLSGQAQKVANLEFNNGILKLNLEMPARREQCEFVIKPLNENVGNLIEYIKNEDKSVEKVVVYNKDGIRYSQNTPMSVVVFQPFTILVNEVVFKIDPPPSLVKPGDLDPVEKQAKKELDEIKQLVSKLYLQLNVEHFEIEQEQKLLKQLEQLKSEVQPMDKIKEDLVERAKRHTNRMVWFGLVAMCVQAGVLARLTWFDYSWDIVEPISYFVSYSAVIGVYAYFVLTRKEYDYESASDRIFLRHLHKNAINNNMNIKRYNEIKTSIYTLENELRKIQETRVKKYIEQQN